eukprot:m.309942 g.309942  ORF g.309942 m.309942 type:complete len:1111 (-) comp20206_c0_seq2:458-3790(-)
MDPIAEKKFKNLRRRLDQLGYRQPLGIETVPLVEKLFADLVHTTESLKRLKERGSTRAQEPKNGTGGPINVEAAIEPYRVDNAKLVKEVNQLHLELIRRKDAMDSNVKKVKSLLRKVEHENADLRFLNTQYAHKLRVLENEAETKNERIQRLLEKNLEAVVETAEGGKRHIATRKQRMDVTSLVSPALAKDLQRLPAPAVTHHRFDLLKIADARVLQLETENKAVHDDKEVILTQLQTLQAQIGRREDEIERLGHLLEGGRPLSSVIADSESHNDGRRLAQLDNQVEFLQESNKALENELVRATADNEELAIKIAELQSKNSGIMQQLGKYDQMSQDLQHDQLHAMAARERELRKEKELFRRQQEQFRDRLASVDVLSTDNLKLKGENQHLLGALAKAEQEADRLHEQLESASAHARSERPGDQMGRTMFSGTGTQYDVAVSTASSDEYKALHTAHTRLQQELDTITKERDFYKMEYNGSSAASRDQTPSKKKLQVRRATADLYGSSYGVSSAELPRFKIEINALATTVHELEQQLQRSDGECQRLMKENADIMLLYKQTVQDSKFAAGSHDGGNPRSNSSPADPASDHSPTDAHGKSMQHDWQHEVDSLRQECHRLKEEVQAAREHATRSSGDLETALHAAEARADQAERRAGTAEMLVRELRTGAAYLEMGGGNAAEMGGGSATRAARNTTSADVPTQDNPDNTGRSNHSDAEFQRLRTALQTLDMERDRLQIELDEQTLTIRNLEAHLEELRQGNTAANEDATAVAQELATTRETVRGKEAEIDSLRRQLHSREDAMRAHDAQTRAAEQKMADLTTDLDNMTRETQAVHADLAAANDTRAQLEAQLSEYEDKLNFAEHMLKQKEEENHTLQDSYRHLSSQATSMESRASEADGVLAEALTEAQDSENRCRELSRVVTAQKLETEELHHRLSQLEHANATLLQDLQKTEQEASEQTLLAAQRSRDLAGAQELCKLTAKARDDAQRQCVAATTAADMHRQQLQQLSLEVRARQAQHQTAHDENSDLQDMLLELRTAAALRETRTQELSAENVALKSTVKELTDRISTMGNEIRSLRQHRHDCDEKIKELEKDIINMQYDAAVADISPSA